MAEPELSFAGLLRQLRAEARLTQEELAEAASLSPQAVAALERGIHRTAHKDTAVSLADALGLPEQVRVVFVAAARGKAPAADVRAAWQGVTPGAFAAAATRALPRDIGAFTGRQAELAALLEAIDGLAVSGGVVGIYAIDGMAGIGKTAFAVHAAHRMAGDYPDGQFFMPLHAHTPGQRPVEPPDALASLLLTAGVPAPQIPPGLEARAARWRDHLTDKKILLVLDDAAGHEQVRPLLPGTAGSLVLITSRRRLTALEDAAVISLDTLPRGEAAELLVRLASRPVLRAGDVAVDKITRLCGYLPLAIGMLARQLRHHPTWTAADLAAGLAEARDRLAVMHAENLSVSAAFGLSYQDLPPGPQRLFRCLGLVPGPDFDAYVVAALDGTSLDQARRHLGELYDQHLLAEPAPGRYQLHDLLREHARALATTADDPAESGMAVGRLLDYYLYTALAASQQAPTWTTAQDRLPPGQLPAHVPRLSTHRQAAAWLETERPNLHAAADHAAAHGWTLHAVQIPAAMGDLLLIHGDWDRAAAVHRTALTAAKRADDRPGQAGALNHLGIVHKMSGDFPAAAASLAQAVELYRDLGDQPGQARVLTQLAYLRSLVGDYPAATTISRQALAVTCASGDRLTSAYALNGLGLVQQLTGDYAAAAAHQRQALALFRDLGYQLGEADALHDLGVVQRETGDYPAAAASLQKALKLYRDLGFRLGEAWAVDGLGVVQRETGDYAAAAASHQHALRLHRGLGHQLGQAEALNRLGQLSSATSATHQARERHAQALAIARDIGVPLEEARALEGIGQAHLKDSNPGEATAYLRQAFTIYQRIGAPSARRVQETVRQHGL